MALAATIGLDRSTTAAGAATAAPVNSIHSVKGETEPPEADLSEEAPWILQKLWSDPQ
jgi:hypothetical protein